MKTTELLRQSIAVAKAKIKSKQCTDAIICSTFYEDRDDTHTVIINPNFIKALRDKSNSGGLPENMVVINMEQVSDPHAISGLIYSLGLVDGE